MKQIDHFTRTTRQQQSLKAGVVLLLMGVMLTLLPASVSAQVLKPFTQRASIYSPDMPIYHIKGDYTLIGNTNLTLATYSDNAYNTDMIYVNVDPNMVNSSTAELTFSEEFGANPACSEVLYAGLYWSGRTTSGGMDLAVDKTLYDGDEIGGYTLTIEESGSNSRIFTFTNRSDTVELTMNRNTINWRTNYTVSNGGEQIYNGNSSTPSINVHLPGTSNTITQLQWEGSWGGSSFSAVVTIPLSKNKIKIKHATAPGYTEVEATPQDIYYATHTDYDYAYAAYAEVTDYVRQYGLGNYTIADLASEAGNGGSTGFFGCWGMVVVYENSKMKWRDITIFDGFANVRNNNTVDVPISGFKTVQVGDVNMKLGVIVSEGDVRNSGDAMKILRQGTTNEFVSLSHDLNSETNFFNSSISTGGNYRNPEYRNNSGIDIAMFELDNENNSVITNNQTSTHFQFTTNSDIYFPFCFVMGVDAYIPEAEALSGVMNIDEDDITIDSQTGNYLIKPGKEITFAVEVKNFGTEDIVDAKLEIPLPSTIVYYRTAVEYVHPGINIEGYFDAERYANGVAGWNIDYIPSGDPNQVYARVLLTVKVTDDCYVLASTDEDCELAIEVNGTLEGISYVNRVYFKKESFISGFVKDVAGCNGNAIRNDIKVVVDKEDYVNNNCQDRNYTVRLVNVCGNDFNAANPIPFMKIYALYPQGSRFFNATTGEEYTAATGFPISLAATDSASAKLIYVQPTSIYSAACTSDLRFILDPDGDSFTTPTLIDSATYCLGAQADSLSRHITGTITGTIPDDVYFRFYKANNDSAVAYVDIVPPTDVEDTLKYWVRQFRENAIGCEDETFYGPITIKVVSPITFTSSEASPSCVGQPVTITGVPEGGRWSWPDTLTGIDTVGNRLTINGDFAGTYTVTYTHNNPGSAGYSCTNTVRSYTHQIAATTYRGDLQSDQTICQGAQIQPLRIVDHNGHIERWEWTTDTTSNHWDPIPNNTSSISSADLGELAVGTYYFRALVKDGNCKAEWTDTVTIEVTDDLAPSPPAVTSPQFACIGTVHTIQPSGDNYQWYEQAIGGWPIEDANGVTVTVTDEYITRYVSEVDAETHCVSDRALVVVRPNLEPGEINSVGQRECDLDETANTIGSDQNAVAYGEEPTVPQYQWYYQANGGTILREIIGANSATYTPSESFMGTEGEYIFIRKAKNPNCDNDDWQQSRGKWRLVVGKPNASIEAVPGHATICQNEGIKLRLSVPASTTYSYQWYRNGDSIPDATGHAYIAIDTGRYTARVTHKASGCSATTPDTNAIEVKYDDDAPRASDVTTTIEGCSIEDARAVTAYDSVRKANDSGLGFNIYDSITPVDSLKLTYTEAETETDSLPDGVCYQLVRTYTVTDQCGFYTTFTHTINVVDNVVPVIGDDNLNTTLTSTDCNFTLPDFTSEVRDISSDNCTARDALVITQSVLEDTHYTPDPTPQTVTVTVTVKDACGNASTKNIDVTIPAALTASATPTHVRCNGGNGSVALTVSGGTTPYSYLWSNDATTEDLSSVPAGTYTVTVADAHGCTATISATIVQPEALQLSITDSSSLCYDLADGYINYTFSGGTPNYTVSIPGKNNSHTDVGSGSFTDLADGSYTVTVTDGNNCVATDTTTIEQINTTLTITAQSYTWEYDGQTHTRPYYNVTFGNEQYSNIAPDSSATLPNGDVVTATVSGSITNAGTVANTVTGVTVTRGDTDVTCYYNIDTVAGALKITPIDVVVTIIGANNTTDYDGTEHTVTGYTATANTSLYDVTNDFTFTPAADATLVDGVIAAKRTNVGTTNMGLAEEQFANTNGNFANVTFNVTDGWQTIEPRPVTLTSATDSKIYDGTPLTNSTVTVGGDGFVTGEGATYDVTGTQTEVGTSYNTFTYTLNSNTDANNYTITKIEGTLTILIDSVPPCIGCDPIAGVSCEDIGNQTRTNDENQNYYTHSGTAWDVNATDNSGAIPVMTWSLTGVTTASGNSTLDGQRFNVGVTTVTWTATDVSENTATCQFTVTVADTTAPVISCPSDIAGIACITDVPAAYADYAAFQTAGGEATDNDVVDYESFALVDADTNGTCPTTITRTYYIEDTTGNSATCEQVITIKDSIAPALTGTWPTNITGQDNCLANADISGLMSNDAVKALYSDCNTFTVIHEDTVTGNNCGWTVTRTYTITDLCRNTVMPKPTMSVSGSDQTAPALAGTWPSDITGQNNCFANADTTGLKDDSEIKALYSDCSAITVTHTDANTLTSDCGWTITRTYTITDACGNDVTNTMSVSGSDQTDPELTGTWPTNITGQDNCLANRNISGLYSNDQVKALYSDCSALTVTSRDTVTGDDCGWTVTRTYTITDACGNTSTNSMSVSGRDQTVPALTGTWPDNITGQDNCFANADISGLYTDAQVKDLYNDCNEFTVSHTDANTLTADCGWTITRTYIITDSCGNTVSPAPTMSVSGSDQTVPALAGTWPTNITSQDNCLANRNISGLYSNDQVKALYSDCSALTVTSRDTVTGDDCGWTVIRTYTITDACDNSVTKTMSVSGSDQTDPVLAEGATWPSDITGQDNCFANADTTGLKDDSEIKALYSDCSAITVTHEDANTSTADCGWTVTRTYTIKDSCGNTVSPAPTMSVSGSDQTDPVIESINLDSTLTATNCVFTIPDMREIVRNISTDCSEITVTQPSAGMEVYPMVAERDTTVNVIVTDICGNSSEKEVIITIPAKVTISATATPAVICNGDTSQLSATAANVVGTAVYAWTPATELSSATIANPTVTLTASGASETVTYTVMVTDDNGCTATATASVTVNPEVVMNTVEDWTLCVGETSPEYVYTSTITDGTVTYGWSNDNSAIGLAAAGSGNLPSFVAANATPANLIAEVKVAPTYANNGISCQGDSINFHITVRPSITTPGNVAFTCPADTTVVLSYSECEQFVNIGYPEFVNNMTGMTVNITNDAPEGNIFPEGTTIVTWTATDECGAFLTCTQNVVVQFPPCGDSIADFDGYRYSSVRIGCQCWTGENARSEHYSDGTPVDNFRYYNDSDSLENIYGKLYTWYTAVRVPEGDDTAVPADSIDPLGNSYVQGICPEGWALPTVDEYMLMIANSGDATHAKDGSNLYWLPGYEGQPPFSGFDAYGAGKYNGAIDRYQDLLGKTYFWTTLSGSGSETATTVEINYYCAEGLQTELSKGDGVSIRCIRKR